MPRGKFVNHKGRSRHFTSPEELQQESEESWSEDDEQPGGSGRFTGELQEGSEGSSSEDDKQPGGSRRKTRGGKAKSGAPAGKMPTSSEEDSEEDRNAKKGVAGLIEIENPNRVIKKTANKISRINLDDEEPAAKPELSRRDREQVEKQKARQRYQKLHAEGKTAQAKADLARLALIRQQRADAAAKREAELKKKATDDKKATEKA